MSKTNWSEVGIKSHLNWEKRRKDENECDAEKRIAEYWQSRGADIQAWWNGWFQRSDEWRSELGL